MSHTSAALIGPDLKENGMPYKRAGPFLALMQTCKRINALGKQPLVSMIHGGLIHSREEFWRKMHACPLCKRYNGAQYTKWVPLPGQDRCKYTVYCCCCRHTVRLFNEREDDLWVEQCTLFVPICDLIHSC
jgi:hypothetical protein